MIRQLVVIINPIKILPALAPLPSDRLCPAGGVKRVPVDLRSNKGWLETVTSPNNET